MKKIILSLLMIFIFSCERVVDLNVPPHNSLLVVNGILDTDSICSIFVSNSMGSFDQGTHTCITDANVVLYEDGISLGAMTIDSINIDTFSIIEDGWWNIINESYIYYYRHNNTFPKTGSMYSIDITHPNYESVFATTTIPNNVDSISYEIVDNLNETYNGTFNISFHDNPNQKNYYRIRLFRHKHSMEDDSWVDDEGIPQVGNKDYALWLYSNDASLSQGSIPWGGYTFGGRTALFSDDLFDGEKKELSFDLEYKLKNISAGDSIFVQFTSYSEDAYNYFNSIQRQRDSFVSPFGTEPVSIYSNIQNGIGIFASGNSIYELVAP